MRQTRAVGQQKHVLAHRAARAAAYSAARHEQPVAERTDHRLAVQRRELLLAAASAAAAAVGPRPAAAAAATESQPTPPVTNDFVRTPSGLLIQDISVGQGRQPQPGDRVVVHWAGRTKNYQAKRFGNTTLKDEPFEFILGTKQVIPAFEEAVGGMHVGGIRRIEVLGEVPELSYPRDRKERFVAPLKYRYGPQPSDLAGQRSLDFVLDNSTLNDTNRTLLFDIKLLGAYSP